MATPFEGLTQGLGAAGAMLDMYNAPQLNQLNLLQQQAKLDQLKGLDPVSQQNIKASQANIDLAAEQERRLQAAQDQETQKYQAVLLGSMAKSILENPEEKEGLFRAVEQLTGKPIPQENRTDETLKQAAIAADLLKTKDKQQVRRSEILQDGTVIAVTDKGQKVYDPAGKLLTGQAAADQIEKANQYKLSQDLESARMGKRGSAEETRRQEIMSGAFKAKSTIPTINNMLSLLDTVETSGFDAAQKKFTDFFGTTPRDVGQFDALAKSLVLQNLRALGSNPTEGERAFIESTSASLSQGGEVNKAILNQMKEIAQRQIKQGRFIAGGGTPEQLLAESPKNTSQEETPASTENTLPEIGVEVMPGVKRLK